MVKAKIPLVVIMLGLAAVLTGACAGQPAEPAPPITPVSREESQRIAEEFLRNSPTFAYDGMEDTLQLTDTLTARCPYCWQFIFEFQSRHAGYGDRTGQMLAQVITPHQAKITVEQGEVTHAVLDAKWDMLSQTFIPK